MDNPIQYLMRLRALLAIEYNCEKEEFRRQTEAAGIERKVKRGDAWWPANVGRSWYNAMNQTVVELTRADGDDTAHNFEPSRPVCFFTLGPGGEAAKPKVTYLGFTATVSYAETGRMVVVLPDSGKVLELQRAGRVGVQLFFDETSYRLMFAALDRAIAARGNRLAALRDIFAGMARPSSFAFAAPPMPWLNASQQNAVGQVLRAKDVAVVHGPPGTGKTTTLVEAIAETLRREPQVLVCAQSNMAVDWISERLVDRGASVLRIGNPTRVDDKMLSFTYERRFEAHPDYPQLWSLRKAIRQLRQQRHTAGWHDKIDRLSSRATEIEVRINADIFGEARVIACTLTGSANRLLDGMTFGTLFVDEAAQALEPACWIALRRARRVVLAGDHCQLPPTVKSVAALKGGLGRTLMERVAESQPGTVTLLNVQYRMNRRIMQFPSEWFYGGQVQSDRSVEWRGILDYDTPMAWIDTAETGAHEEYAGENFGRINRAEAEATVASLRQYMANIGRQRIEDEHIDVGVISPYRAQVQLLRKLIRADAALKPLRTCISVGTVDGFQGQERDIIIISTVRDNDKGEIGFLRDLRRMNVAITRARMKVIVVGSVQTLTKHPFYKRLHEYICSL